MTDSELLAHIDKVAADFQGEAPQIYAAIGATMACRSYGWRVVRLTTASSVYTRHQRIMGLDFKEIFPEETELSSKSYGYKMVKKLDKFWQAVNHTFSMEAKTKILFE